ncbi:lactonase family protein [Amycolatopsis pithecellobii]|uniref:Beta-propeller fold lactonase family protein n=1 Tax=Amycolatopsis pithecellobii TaxID=664692 RepID=A0A6N7YWB7_9PSEU|nr:lactonase family protein [Amycolatopsis pithecellobii]MTD57377.1 beta-propeller fold lactonase family protein [Amycolatopsis pithecellobii]
MFPRRIFLGITAFALAATPAMTARAGQRHRAFVGSYTNSDPAGHGLDVVKAGKPGLDADFTVPGVPDASWFARRGNVLYVTNESDPGSVTALDISGKPRILGTQPALGAAPTHLSVHPSGRYLLTANYTSGSVVVHPILPGGGLGAATDLVEHGDGAHAHQVVTDPSGRWVLAVDLGTDSVYVYQLTNGKLRPHQQLVLPAGSGPRHLAFHPHERLAYLACELTPVVTVLGWDPAGGTVTAEQVVDTASSPGPNYPGEIEVSADGRFVYVSVRGENTIATFAVRGRELVRLGENMPSGGVWPRHFTLDAGQRWMYVSNQRSGTVNWLPRDPTTGRLGAAAGSLAVPSVATVLL